MNRIITIDGPAGAGKSTISRMLAQRLGCIWVDTGALYRGVAYEICSRNIPWEDDQALAGFLVSLDLKFVLEKDGIRLISTGQDITARIRTPEITLLASATSARPAIRAALLDIQKTIAREQDAVFEGRDMGTVVFPDASAKFFLVADPVVRARRRWQETPDGGKDLNAILADILRRDAADAHREQSPLKPATDAIQIDSTALTPDGVVDLMLEHLSRLPHNFY